MPLHAAEIIAIGSELLLGGRLDTNSLFLTDQLAAFGIEVRFKSIVGDDIRDIAAALKIACRRADIVLLTGGLGPTDDDCTRQAVAAVTGRPLCRDADAVAGMQERLAAWGRTPSRAQMRQGLLPRGATVLGNPVGSAPGFVLQWKGTWVAALPGVPIEAERMFAESLAPRLDARRASGPGIIRRHLIHTFGLPESDVEQCLKPAVRAGAGLRLGFLASPLGVTISLTACGRGSAGPRATKDLDTAIRSVRACLGTYVYAEGEDTMETVLGRELMKRGLCLAVAESCTGGLIGHRLTNVPGSSEYLDRVAVTYSNEAKQEMLGVPASVLRAHGAVSAETAGAMALGIRRKSRAQIGLSVTGIAGPGGGTERKPVGLVYVGVSAGTVLTKEFRFHGSRDMIKWRASQAALDLVRHWLMEEASRASGRPRR